MRAGVNEGKLGPWMPTTPDIRGLMPESWACVDCVANTAPGVPNRIEAEQVMATCHGTRKVTVTDQCEIYMVRDSVWKKAGMESMGGCLCIGCPERRIGRCLKRKDFLDHALNWLPGTSRLQSRRS
jgi:hypothetical protein